MVFLVLFGFFGSLILLGIIGYRLQKRFGKKKYRKEILPQIQKNMAVLRENIWYRSIWEDALDPEQWKTDTKSVLLILIGLPIGVFIMFGIIFFLFSLFNR